MGGHNSYTFTGNASQLSYRPFKFSGESDSIKALRKEALAKNGVHTAQLPCNVFANRCRRNVMDRLKDKRDFKSATGARSNDCST